MLSQLFSSVIVCICHSTGSVMWTSWSETSRDAGRTDCGSSRFTAGDRRVSPHPGI